MQKNAPASIDFGQHDGHIGSRSTWFAKFQLDRLDVNVVVRRVERIGGEVVWRGIVVKHRAIPSIRCVIECSVVFRDPYCEFPLPLRERGRKVLTFYKIRAWEESIRLGCVKWAET